jgi:methyl-accepting chemotaxis protein
VARRIADEGDLTQALPLASTGDEVEVLTQAFAGMVQRLKTIPVTLGESVSKLSQVVETLTAMTTQQAQQLSRQAAAVQQTSVTVREIEETSKLASGKAVSVVEVAARAESLGQSGQRSLNETLARLQEIQEQVQSVMGRVEALSERTGQVGEITETVKELATQSKVLALNAAIEAVKAGEQGKGFSVVAREIRGLAAESLASTERVRGILSEVQESIVAVVSGSRSGAGRIQQSTEQVRSGGEDIQKLANVVEENASAARQIAAAVSQQDAGIKQIAVAIADLNQMLTESAKALQETNDVAQELKLVAQGVSEVVQRFRV